MLLANKTAYRSVASLLAPLGSKNRYFKSDVPKKVFKDFQKNVESIYDVLVTHFDVRTADTYVHIIKYTKTIDVMSEIKNDFNNLFKDPNFISNESDFKFNMDSLNESLGLINYYEACVCRVGSRYYRGEILR